MALLDLATYRAFVGAAATGTDAQYTLMIAECIDAVLKYLNNGTIEQSSYAVVLPAPNRPTLTFYHFPILASSLQVYLNLDANGDISKFTPSTLLTPGSDYILNTGPDDNAYSYTSRIDSQNGPFGCGNWVRPIYSLSTRLQPVPGAIYATYTAGWPTVPPSIQAALCLMVSRLYQIRFLGSFANSQSWNGFSYSTTAPILLFNDPMIRALLRPFTRGTFIGSYTGGV